MRRAVADPANRIYVSAASGWEIAIKLSIGKLDAPPNVGVWLPTALMSHRFTALAIELQHVLGVEDLPRLHGDPFDRLLVTQAQAMSLVIATGDPQIERYGVPLLKCW